MKVDRNKVKKWIFDNLLLILTFGGVLVGQFQLFLILSSKCHLLCSRCSLWPAPLLPRPREVHHPPDSLPRGALHEDHQVDDSPARHRQPRDGLSEPQRQDERNDRPENHPLLPGDVSPGLHCRSDLGLDPPPGRLQHQVHVG